MSTDWAKFASSFGSASGTGDDGKYSRDGIHGNARDEAPRCAASVMPLARARIPEMKPGGRAKPRGIEDKL
jgi:hypothetical protein